MATIYFSTINSENYTMLRNGSHHDYINYQCNFLMIEIICHCNTLRKERYS